MKIVLFGMSWFNYSNSIRCALECLGHDVLMIIDDNKGFHSNSLALNKIKMLEYKPDLFINFGGNYRYNLIDADFLNNISGIKISIFLDAIDFVGTVEQNFQLYDKTMINVGKRFPELRVVNDQIGTPTYTFDLARLLVDMIDTKKYGYYHATNKGGYISWYDFACEIFKQAGYDTKVMSVTTAEYGLSKAARPFNSSLGKDKVLENGFTPLPDWKDALSRYLDMLK